MYLLFVPQIPRISHACELKQCCWNWVTLWTQNFSENIGNKYFILIILTYLLTPRSRVLLEKPTSFRLIKKFPAFYGTRRFITLLTSARHLSLFCAYCMIVSLLDMFLRWGFFSTSPNPQAGGPPLVGSPWPLIQYIRSYPPYRTPFLHPQPNDAPWRGDRDSLTTDIYLN